MSRLGESEEFRPRVRVFARDMAKIVATRPQERAALRRSLGGDPRNVDDIHPVARRVVVPHVDPGDGAVRERAFYTVAALIAAQPRENLLRAETNDGDDPAPETPVSDESTTQRTTHDERDGRNLGAALALAAVDRAKATHGLRLDIDQKAQRFPEEDRLHLLCRQDNEGLHRFMPKVMRFLRARNRMPDWVNLTCDLAMWSGRGRDIAAKAWLDSFYRTLDAEKREERRKKNTNSDAE